MKRIININLLLIIIVLATGCFKEHSEVLPGGENSASIIVTNVSSGFYNLLDLDNAEVSFSIDAAPNSQEIASVDILGSYNSVNEADFVTITTVNSLPATITISAAQAASTAGIPVEDIAVGDIFRYKFRINTVSGNEVLPAASVNASAACPSALEGTYSATATGTSTDGCCPGEVTVESTVTVTRTGDGVYTINDFSGGLYLEWYAVYGISSPDQSPGTFRDVCGELTIFNTNEPFGTAVTGSGSVDENTGVITYTWTNGYDDTGTVILTPN